MIFALLLALVSGANILFTDRFPTPLYLQTPERQFINLQEHLVMPDVPLSNLWKYRFALPILMQAYPGSQLKTTADYDKSLLVEIRSEFKRPTISSDLQHPFGNVPVDKLVTAQEELMGDWEIINEVLNRPLKYESNAKFRELVDRFGLLQVVCSLEDWLEIDPDEIEGLPQLPTGFAKLDFLATEMHHKGEPAPNPFYATLVWEPCSRYRSPVTQLDCWAQVDTESMIIHGSIEQTIKNAGKVENIESAHLSLEVSRRFLRLQNREVLYFLLANGHSDTFVESNDREQDFGLRISAYEQTLFASEQIEDLADCFLENNDMNRNALAFLARRLIKLVMEQTDRSAETEAMLIDALSTNPDYLWPLFRSFRPLHPIERPPGFEFTMIWPLYEAAAILAPDNQADWVGLRPEDYSEWFSVGYHVLIMNHWSEEGGAISEKIQELLMRYKPQAEINQYELYPLNPNDLELLYSIAIKFEWNLAATSQLLSELSDQGSGLPKQVPVPNHPELLLKHVVKFDPRPVVGLIQQHGWDLLKAISSDHNYSGKDPKDKRYWRPYLASLLSRSVINDLSLYHRLQSHIWNLSVDQESLEKMQQPLGGYDPGFFWFLAQQNPKLISRGNLSRLLPEPSLVQAILANSPILRAQACDIAERLIGELRMPHRRLTPFDNFAIRLAMVWLPAVEQDNDRLAKFLETFESFHRGSFRAALGRFITPQALTRQYQQYEENLHLILSNRRSMNPPLQRIAKKYHLRIHDPIEINEDQKVEENKNKEKQGIKRKRDESQTSNKTPKNEQHQ